MKQKLLEEWLAKAMGDAESARDLISMHKPIHADPICFHCQQAIEKTLKALIFKDSGRPPERVHDLVYLLDRAREPNAAIPDGLDDDVEVLDRFSVAFRYPGVAATPDEAVDACSRMERVLAALSPLLE
jgi:HEPN domain-containing protein